MEAEASCDRIGSSTSTLRGAPFKSSHATCAIGTSSRSGSTMQGLRKLVIPTRVRSSAVSSTKACSSLGRSTRNDLGLPRPIRRREYNYKLIEPVLSPESQDGLVSVVTSRVLACTKSHDYRAGSLNLNSRSCFIPQSPIDWSKLSISAPNLDNFKLNLGAVERLNSYQTYVQQQVARTHLLMIMAAISTSTFRE